tara:strand:+ start:165 stop:656 length:492 start_codon:yes stop_codon:yes gene_type:complete
MCQGDSVHKNKIGIYFLVITAGIAILTAFSHMSCIAIGESCYRAQLAPEPIIQSAINGTMLAPVGTIFISILFILCAAYALSAAKLIVQLPLLNMGIYTISALCLFRGVQPYHYLLCSLTWLVIFQSLPVQFGLFLGCCFCLAFVLLMLWLNRHITRRVNQIP